jgi:hypothetical protein
LFFNSFSTCHRLLPSPPTLLNNSEHSVGLNERRRTDDELRKTSSLRKSWFNKRRRRGRGLRRKNGDWRQRRGRS